MDPYESKYKFLINKHEEVGLKHCKDLEAFLKFTNDTNDFNSSIEQYNSGKKKKVLIESGDMIADIICNRKLYEVVTEA